MLEVRKLSHSRTTIRRLSDFVFSSQGHAFQSSLFGSNLCYPSHCTWNWLSTSPFISSI